MDNNTFIAGTYKQQLEYNPSSLNRDFHFSDTKILVLLEQAMRYLAELNAYSRLVPDVDFFLTSSPA